MTGGAAGALFIITTSLLGPDNHLVVVRPNYATNLETPRAIGCEISFIDLSFEDKFRVDIDADCRGDYAQDQNCQRDHAA